MARRTSRTGYFGKRGRQPHNQKRLAAILGLPTPGPVSQALIRRCGLAPLTGRVFLYFSHAFSAEGDFDAHSSYAVGDAIKQSVSVVASAGAMRIDPDTPTVDPQPAWSLIYDGQGTGVTFAGGATLSAFSVGVSGMVAFPDNAGHDTPVRLRFCNAMSMANVPPPSLFTWNDDGDSFKPSAFTWVDPYTCILSGWNAAAGDGTSPDHLSYRYGLADDAAVVPAELRVLDGLLGLAAQEVEISVP